MSYARPASLPASPCRQRCTTSQASSTATAWPLLAHRSHAMNTTAPQMQQCNYRSTDGSQEQTATSPPRSCVRCGRHSRRRWTR